MAMAERLPLAPIPESARLARQFVVGWVCAWGYDHVAPDAQLLASEVVTNAVIHGAAPLVVEVADLEDGILVAVEDAVAVLPVLREPTGMLAGGRGLAIVNQIASMWGAARAPDGGKVVWFKIEATHDADTPQ